VVEEKSVIEEIPGGYMSILLIVGIIILVVATWILTRRRKVPSAQASSGMKFCENCGQQIPKEIRFYSHCGVE
jgi:LPXTG-motif cell wall-anchored protein